MKTEDFIYKNIAMLLTKENKDVKQGLIAQAAKVGKNHFLSHGNFNKKAFDVCYKEAQKHLKMLIKAKL